MEEVEELGNKICAQYLQELQTRYGATDPILIRPDKRHAAFANLDQKMCGHLQEHGWGKVVQTSKLELDENGAPRQFDLTALHLLPPAEEYLRSRTVTETTTRTVTETFQDPEEPAWKTNQRFRDRVRTERGNAITTSPPAALESNVRGHIQAIRSGMIPHKDMKSHQMWLMYSLLWRWNDIPEPLRHEAEDCRDLQFTRRKKKP